MRLPARHLPYMGVKGLEYICAEAEALQTSHAPGCDAVGSAPVRLTPASCCRLPNWQPAANTAS